jgi:hypothetical protein
MSLGYTLLSRQGRKSETITPAVPSAPRIMPGPIEIDDQVRRSTVLEPRV